jgi:hypothetical protein
VNLHVRLSLLHCLYKVFECEDRRSRLLNRPRDLLLTDAKALRPATIEITFATGAEPGMVLLSSFLPYIV